MNDAVIVDAVRTASGRGKPNGALAGIHPVDLSARVLLELVRRTGIDPGSIDDVLWGAVSQVGEQSANVARNAVLAAGFDVRVPATTIDRQCGSSQQAVHFAAQGIMAGSYDVVVAGGVESMSRIPLGTASLGVDGVSPLMRDRFRDGLVSQGVSAELIASEWGLGRDELDEFAAASHERATRAREAGHFSESIVPVATADGTHAEDETIRPGTSVEALANLPSAFRTDAIADRFPEVGWNITAGNSSPFTDGASAALLMSAAMADRLGLTPRARIHAMTVAGADPLLMLTAPIPATQRVLERSGLTIDDLDAYEVNEAFASVPLAWSRALHADPQRMNPWGGAIALGHALGSSGTRLLSTLVDYLEWSGGRFGLQTMCEGGGQANAMIIERWR